MWVGAYVVSLPFSLFLMELLALRASVALFLLQRLGGWVARQSLFVCSHGVQPDLSVATSV